MLPQRTAIARAVRQLRPSNFSRRNPASLVTRQAGRRAYASASETAQKATHAAKKVVKQSELPWILGAAGVTIPGTYLILANGTWGAEPDYPGAKWHGEHDDEEHDEEEEEGEEKEEGEEGDEPKKEAEEGEDKEEGDDNEQKEEGNDANDEGGEGEEGKEGDENKEADAAAKDDSPDKGEQADDEKGEAEQDKGDSESETTRKPDAKGGVKRRVESGNANKLGEKGDEDHPDDDKASSGKPAKDGSQEAKQSGLSNTDTKHSIDVKNDSEHSTKGSGTPETAKSQGTVKS